VEKFSQEYETLHRLSHPNIIKVHGMMVQPPLLCLVFDLCELGELTDHITRISVRSWPDKLSVMLSIARAVAHLHNQRPPVVHRDLKPANFLLKDGLTPVLADFGSSRLISSASDMLSTFAGSPLYMAPEILNQTEYDCKVDIYSLGMLYWQLLAGKLPFAEDLAKPSFNLSALTSKVNSNIRPSLTGPGFQSASEGLLELLSSCWQTEANARPSANRLVAELENLLHNEMEIENLTNTTRSEKLGHRRNTHVLETEEKEGNSKSASYSQSTVVSAVSSVVSRVRDSAKRSIHSLSNRS